MSLSRINDDEIQDYLDGNLSARENKDFRGRLQNCNKSQEKLREYIYLYKALKLEEIHSCSPTLIETVMSKLPPAEEPKRIPTVANIIAATVGFVVVVALLHYFIDLTPYVNKLAGLPFFNLDINWKVFNNLVSLIQKLNTDYYLFGFVALVLMLVKIVDFMLLETEYKKVEH